MIQAVTAEETTPFDRLMLLLVGREKSGKSRTAATGRPPILFFDFDKRRQSLAGIKDTYILTFVDEATPGKQPTAFTEFETALGYLEREKTLKALGMHYGINTWPDVPPVTVVVDSLASLAKLAMDYALYTNKDIRRELVIGGKRLYLTKNWDTWNAEMKAVEQPLNQLVAMVDKDLIIICHEAAEETADSTDENRKYTGRFDIYPGRYRSLNKYFSEVWRCTREGNSTVPVIQVMPSYKFTASSNLDFTKLKPEQINPPTGPNIRELIRLTCDGKV